MTNKNERVKGHMMLLAGWIWQSTNLAFAAVLQTNYAFDDVISDYIAFYLRMDLGSKLYN